MQKRLAAILAVVVFLAPAWAAAQPDAPASRVAEFVGGATSASEGAVRGVQWPVDATCDLTTVSALATRHPDVRQFVVLDTDSFGSTVGTAFVAARGSGGQWHCQTNEFSARFGRTGTRPLLERRSGDGTTPAGVFPLGETTAWDGGVVNVFGNRPDPGVRAGIAYRSVRQQDCWGAIPGDSNYNKLVDFPGCSGPDNEWLPRFGDVYSHAAVIGANMDPISGDSSDEADRAYAAAIFLHRHSYTSGGSTRPTSGCVSLASGALVDVIRLLDPRLAPHFAIGPTSWLRASA